VRAAPVAACLAALAWLSGTVLVGQAAPPDPQALTPAPSGTASPGPAPGEPAPSPAPSPPVYRLGSGDVLDVVVFGNPELSRTATIQNDGTISLPLLGQVEVSGLSLSEAENLILQRLGDKYLVDPQVEVQVREYHSQFVTVLGEINNPGRKGLKGVTRLIDVLLDSGGLRPTASGEIVVARPGGFPDGSGNRRGRLTPGTFGIAEQELLGLALQSGDIITALPKYFVTVQGEVVRPSRYQIESDLTVTGVVSLAGGLTRFGSHKVDILRNDGGVPRRLEADLKAISEGRAPDVRLQPNDIVTVGRRLF
jgi:polysaccharide export outer membrane protein